MEVLISIIVPIYNSENSIAGMLDSICKSKHKNIEILLVDDGSTDNSLFVCEEYAQKDNRITVIHKENGGVSSARNRGIEAAHGAYITFFDSDDTIVSKTLDQMMCILPDNNLDMITADIVYFDMFTKKETVSGASLPSNRKMNKVDIITCFISPLVLRSGTGLASVCNKFFKRSIIVSNDIKFEEKVYKGEDWRFILDFLSVAETAYYIPEVLYEYRLDGSQKEEKYKRIPGIHLLGAWKRKIEINEKYSLGATNKTIIGWYASLIDEVVFSARNECPLDELQRILSDETVKRASIEVLQIKGQRLIQMEVSRKIKLYAILIRYHLIYLLRIVARRLGF